MAAKGRREGGDAEGSQVALVVLTGQAKGTLLSATRLQDGAGAGWSLGADCGGRSARLQAEAVRWRPAGNAQTRSAWLVTVGLRARFAGAELQVAAREPGFDPPSGTRPATLPTGGERGWALRGRWRGGGIVARGMAAAAVVARTAGEAPATAVMSRAEFSLAGGDRDVVTWRCRSTWKAERVTGWASRMPWLPAAELSARSESRLSARLSGRTAGVSLRLGARTAHFTRVGGDGGRRSLVSLRVERDCGGGFDLRCNQVWAWGDDVDLVSVEVPVAGMPRSRHWGRWQSERSLGLVWNGGGCRVSTAIAVRVEEGGEVEIEPLFRAVWSR